MAGEFDGLRVAGGSLVGDHDIDPGESILGPWIECDPAGECVKDNPRANELVRGFYRKPFEVPEVTA